MLNLHQLVESELEAPALAWNILAYYWGMSAFGLGPAYIEYMQSDQPTIDTAFNDALNDDLNQIAGLERRLTIKERFDRAINFYAYCVDQGRRYSINPPYDMPPDVDALVASRLKMEAKAPTADKLIQASNESLLGDRPDLLKLWAMGGTEKRERRAQEYNARVLDTLNYVASEIKSRTQLSEINSVKPVSSLKTCVVNNSMSLHNSWTKPCPLMYRMPSLANATYNASWLAPNSFLVCNAREYSGRITPWDITLSWPCTTMKTKPVSVQSTSPQ
jgi:hypothetical protein